MFIVIDRDAMRMVAAADSHEWARYIAYCDFSHCAIAIVDSENGKSWSVFSDTEMKMLYRNMSGLEPPPFGDCVGQLRDYARTWQNYHISLFDLKVKAPQLGVDPEPPKKARPAPVRYAAIYGKAADPAAVSHAPADKRGGSKPPAEKSSDGASSAPRKPGATKMVWDICDGLMADLSLPIPDIKAFREAAKARCSESGINEGTFGVQFGKWKKERGI